MNRLLYVIGSGLVVAGVWVGLEPTGYTLATAGGFALLASFILSH